MNMCAWLEMIIRNGMVGDWTLRDGKFMESFRLPRPGEKLDALHRESRMPGESCIRFDVHSAEGAEALCDNHCAQAIGLPGLSSVHRAFEDGHVRG